VRARIDDLNARIDVLNIEVDLLKAKVELNYFFTNDYRAEKQYPETKKLEQHSMNEQALNEVKAGEQ
jgi:hypothetical protein